MALHGDDKSRKIGHLCAESGIFPFLMKREYTQLTTDNSS